MRLSASPSVSCVFGAALHLLSIVIPGVAAAEPAICPYRFGPATQSTLRSLWNDAATYWVGSHAVESNEFEVVIAGDVLDLSPQTFSMLARTEDQPITNWRRVVFDAREIVVRMPLIFSNAKIELRAEKISFMPEGRIALKNAPVNKVEDGVKLVADSVDFSNAALVPFDFETDHWAAYPNNDNDVAPDLRWQRTLNILAKDLVPSRNITGPATDTWRWMRQLTRDRYVPIYGGPASTFSRRPYNIVVGTDGAEGYNQALADEMLWPESYAARIETAFSQQPFAPEAKALFSEELRLQYHLERFRDMTRHASARQKLTFISLAMTSETNLAGERADFVPRVKFETLRNAFQAQFGGSEKLSVKAVQHALGESELSVSAANKTSALSELRQAKTKLNDALSSMRDRGQILAGEVNSLQQAYDAEAAALAAFGQQVDEWAAQQSKSLEDRKRLGIAIQAIGLAGTAVVGAYGGPAAGAIFAKSWGTIGAAVEKHQDGNTPENLEALQAIIEVGVKQGEEWSSTAGQLQSQWTAVGQSAQQGKTVVEQAALVTELAKTMAGQINKLSKRADASKTGLSSFDLDPNWKHKAEELQAKINITNAQIVKNQAEMADLAQRISQNLSKLSDLTQMELALNAATPANAFQNAELHAFYKGLTSRLLSDLASSYQLLAKAFAYHTLQTASQVDYSPVRDAISLINSQQLTTLVNGAAASTFSTVDLAAAVQKTYDNYSSVLIQMDQAVIDSYQRNTNSTVISDVWRFANAASEDQTKQSVVLAIDEGLQSAFAKIKKAHLPGGELSFVVPINPFVFLGAPNNTTEFVKNAIVSRLEFKGVFSKDAHIEFTLLHPGYGNLYLDDKCYFVNFADSAARKNGREFPAVLQADGTTLVGPSVGDDIYAFMPLRTNWAVRVRVLRTRTDTNFSSWIAPRISGMDIHVDYIRR